MRPDGVPNDISDLIATTSADAGKTIVVSADGKSFALANPWPVGAIFIAAVATNPATLLGFGTWAAFGAGRVLVGIDAGQAEFDTLEETGGAKTHTLTSAEMPAHVHQQQLNNSGGTTLPMAFGAAGSTRHHVAASAVVDAGTELNTASTGGGGAHNNLQPYITCHFWKRVA